MEIDKPPPDEFVPRPYQTEILEISVKQNTIIFLPTGSGKTYIAVMLINRLSHQIISPNMKKTFLLVNTVPLIEQHCMTLKRHTDFEVGHFSGDMNVDFWNKQQWSEQFSKYQVIVMTAQIFLDIIRHRYFSLECANLLIFDECHQAVNDQPMRQIMQTFENVQDRSKLPRVLGLTATLLNGNCPAHKVIEEVLSLETTFHSKVATVQNLTQIIGFSTNPQEKILYFQNLQSNSVTENVRKILNDMYTFISSVRLPNNIPSSKNLFNSNEDKPVKELKRVITSLMLHIDMLGIYGGSKATLSYIIQIERMKRHADSTKISMVYNAVGTCLTMIKKLLDDSMCGYSVKTQIYKFSSHQVLTLIEILKTFKDKSLCGIVFVQQRFTSKALYYILKDLSNNDSDFNFIQCDFMFGFNAGSKERDTRETYYAAKINKKIVDSFRNQEINLLIASNVVEEGIDIPTCTLVVKFDRPMEYRSYIQSKGRARHNTSSYYMMVPLNEKEKFKDKYRKYQKVEKMLQNYLVGKTEERKLPSDAKIQSELYDDHDVPPYYVDGPNSAYVTSTGAISLLNRYCQQLLRDRYTQLAPNWYIEQEIHNGVAMNVVVIEMPICCPIREKVKGLPMTTRQSAKRSAAMEVIKKLHQIGELTDKLFPQNDEEYEENFKHFFKHWPVEKEVLDETDDVDKKFQPKPGTKKFIRVYDIVIPPFINSRDKSLMDNEYYIYPILMSSVETNHPMNSIHNEMVSSELGFGLLTQNCIPEICTFPIFLSAGEIQIKLGPKFKVILNDEEKNLVIKHHYFIFQHLLQIMQYFLTFDMNKDAELMLIVPIFKYSEKEMCLEMNIMKKFSVLDEVVEPSIQERINMEVTEETHLKKIVCPWYRRNDSIYLVIGVCRDLSAQSAFPSPDFTTYEHYFLEKYKQEIYSPNLPLLLVKGIKKKMNCILPRSATLHGSTKKRNKEIERESFDEHLIPELCTVQKYPGQLWYQAYCLPTIIYRIMCLMRCEHLRRIISQETGLGPIHNISTPLYVDQRILHQEQKKIEPIPERNVTGTDNVLALPSTSTKSQKLTNKDYAAKMLEKQYSWKDDQEPIDIDRSIEKLTLFDIEYYESFINEKYTYEDAKKLLSPTKTSKYPALTLPHNYSPMKISMLNNIDDSPSNYPDQSLIFQSVTAIKANEIVNFERLETLGDSFLKLASSLYLFLAYPRYGEGRLTHIKGKIIGNRNLLYCGLQKNLGGFMNVSDFAPRTDWLPPSFCVPQFITDLIQKETISVYSLFSFGLTEEEQLSGILTESSVSEILETVEDLSADDTMPKEIVSGMNKFLKRQSIPDKTISDCVEALIGAYLLKRGVVGALSILRWFQILPINNSDISEQGIFNIQPENPLFNPLTTQVEVDFYIPNYAKLEEHLGYKFKNRAYLLQAVTHASFSINRVTDCYQRLEFLGDAVLDFLITCHIYEISDTLTPGQLTDLRSALVNNVTFACLVVRYGFYKHLKFINTKLMDAIDNFVKFQELRDHAINEEALILIEDHPMYIAEHVDVPKVLGDLFESLAGAIFLDTGRDLQKTWEVFHALMWNEIETFRRDVPKNPVRMLYETVSAAPKFEDPIITKGITCVTCSVLLKGKKHYVHGFGENKIQAKSAAAKLALKLLSCK